VSTTGNTLVMAVAVLVAAIIAWIIDILILVAFMQKLVELFINLAVITTYPAI
jgi:hypothetical protein